MAGRGVDEGGRKPAGSGWAKSPPSAHGSTVPGTEIAAMERHRAPAFSKEGAALKDNGCATWRSIPLTVVREREGDYGVPGADKEHGRFRLSAV